MKSVDNKRPLKAFLCHAHADRDPARTLYTRLTKDGVDIMAEGYAWFDKAKLLPGQDWELEIRKAQSGHHSQNETANESQSRFMK